MTKLLDWFRSHTEDRIPNWTPRRVDQYHKETLKMYGRGETAYEWSKRYAQSCHADLGPILATPSGALRPRSRTRSLTNAPASVPGVRIYRDECR